MNNTINISDININSAGYFNVNPTEPITCQATFQDFINTTSDTLNLRILWVLVAYVMVLTVTQMLYDQKKLKLELYLEIHKWVNDVALVITVIFLGYSLLLM